MFLLFPSHLGVSVPLWSPRAPGVSECLLAVARSGDKEFPPDTPVGELEAARRGPRRRRPQVDVAALDPLVYIAGSREYRKLGDKVADAFEIGKALRDA